MVDVSAGPRRARLLRRLRVTSGLLLVSAAVTVSCSPVRQWSATAYLYPYRPTYLVMRDLRDGEGQPPPANAPSKYFPMSGHGWVSEQVDLARVALDELLRREQVKQLSPDYRQQIDQLALSDLHRPITTPGQFYLRQNLGDRWMAGRLPAAELDQLYRAAIHVRLETDREVWQWNEVPLRLRCRCDLPNGSTGHWTLTAHYGSVEIDGKSVQVTPPNWVGSDTQLAFQRNGEVTDGDDEPAGQDRPVAGESIRYWALGRHQIDVTLRLDVAVGADSNDRGGRIVYGVVVPLRASFVEQAPPFIVKCVRFLLDPAGEAGHYVTPARLDWLSKHAPPGVGGLARAELMRRGRLLELSPDQSRRLVDDMLQEQADRTRVWHPEYGDYIERAHGERRLPADQWAEYGRHQLRFYVRCRDRINEGDPLPFDLVWVARRGDSQDRDYTGGQWTTHVDFSDGVPGPIHQEPLNMGIHFDGTEFPSLTSVRIGPARPGTYAMRARITDYDLTWTTRPPDLQIPTDYDMGQVSFAVVPPGVDLVPPVVDPSLAKPIASCVSIENLLLWNDGLLTGSIGIRRPPADVAFHVVLLANGR